MLLNRTRSSVALAILLTVLASTALGQGPAGMQLFGPADLSTYGAPSVRPNEGYFFTFDGLYWSVQAPRTALIGDTGYREVASGVEQVYISPTNQFPQAVTFSQTSTDTTGALTNNFQTGQRFEFGRVEDNNGWLVSILRWGPGDQKFFSHRANVLFNDPIDPNTGHGLLYGRIGDGLLVSGTTSTTVHVDDNLPVVFDTIRVRNKIDVWGVEASYLRRSHTFHNGGNVELFLGARYLEFNAQFTVLGYGGVLDDNTYWKTRGNNHIVGPQIGGRYFKQQGRWVFSTEGRFLAGFNMQNISQNGEFGHTGEPVAIQKPLSWRGSEYSHRETINEFSPVAELRLDLRYVITRAVSFRVGWNGIWMGSIARPSDMIIYQVPDMGINTANNRQNVFVNGVSIGFDINR